VLLSSRLWQGSSSHHLAWDDTVQPASSTWCRQYSKQQSDPRPPAALLSSKGYTSTKAPTLGIQSIDWGILSWLAYRKFGMSSSDLEVAWQRIAAELAAQTGQLDLSDLQLSALPPELQGLTSLQTLICRNTQVSNLEPLRSCWLASMNGAVDQFSQISPGFSANS